MLRFCWSLVSYFQQVCFLVRNVDIWNLSVADRASTKKHDSSTDFDSLSRKTCELAWNAVKNTATVLSSVGDLLSDLKIQGRRAVLFGLNRCIQATTSFVRWNETSISDFSV